MRIVKFYEYGSADVLKMETADVPNPSAGQVRVKMKALALNRANSLFREGNYLLEASFPSRIGAEGVGIIDAIGDKVMGLQRGQRVSLLPPASESENGYAADYNIVDENSILPAPEGLDDRQAATAWIPFLTLYHLFVEQELASRGKWMVLPAASSSVSLAANNLAQYLGAKTIGLTRTSKKVKALKNLGYDEVIVAQEEDIAARILEITSGGADFVFDPVGGSQLEKLVASVKPGAPINVYGLLAPEVTALPIFGLMNSGAVLSCYTVYELLIDPPRLKAAIEYFLPLFKSGNLAPIVDKQRHSFDQIIDGFKHLESNTQLGKVIVDF